MLEKQQRLSYLAVAVLSALALVVAATVAGVRPAHAAFPGVNGKLAYSSFSGSGDSPTDLYAMNPSPEGTTNVPRPLTSSAPVGVAGSSLQPAFSPGGYTIAFVAGGHSDVWKVNYDGTGLTHLTRNLISNPQRYCWVAGPTYSPDGGHIAFATDPGKCGGGGAIYVMDSDGTNLRSLATSSKYYHILSWSPDGSQIAFLRSSGDFAGNPLAGNQLGVVNPDGTNQHLLATASTGTNFSGLDYSPDASKLIFFDEGIDEATRGLWTVNADGTGLAHMPHVLEARSVVFSPSGTKIACACGTGTGTQIATANSSDGSGETFLSSSPQYKNDVSWGRNPLFLFRWHIDPSFLKPNYPALISGTFTDKGGDLVPNASLTLWQRPEGTKNFTQVQGQSATTAKDGTFAFGKLYPKTSTYYQVRYAGSDKRDIPAIYSVAKEVVVK